jgi:hypothetical protein
LIKIEKESSDLEPVTKPLIDLANTEDWKSALNVLYLNGGILNFVEGSAVPVLISLNGDDQDVERMIDLLMGKAKTDITPLLGILMRVFVPKLAVISQRKEFKDANGQNQEVLGVMAAMELKGEWERNQKLIGEAILEGAFTIAHMLAAGAYKTLEEKRDSHIDTTLDDDTYEEMIEGLRKVGVIEARLQVSLCPQCGNYQLLVSPSPSVQEACPKCGEEWPTQTLYTFAKPLDKIKSENNDLPLFISSYLRFKINSNWPMNEVEIFPNAEILLESGEKVEIDVFLPQYGIGIECKSFEDCYAPLTESRMNSIIGRLVPQVKRYLGVGATKIVVTTNLPEDATQKVAEALMKTLARENIKPEALNFIEGDVAKLVGFLDSLGQEIARRVSDAFTKSITSSSQENMPKVSDQTMEVQHVTQDLVSREKEAAK